jgi:hypothetical protein
VVGALGYWFILLLPYKSIAKHPYQLQKPKDILFYIKYNYNIISWCYRKHIYSNNSSLRATKGKFYTIKQLWRLCQSLCCLCSTSTSFIRLCLTLFPMLFLCLYFYNIPYILWLKLPYMPLTISRGLYRSRCSYRDLDKRACFSRVSRRNNFVVIVAIAVALAFITSLIFSNLSN